MPLSNLTAYTAIPENSAATPGLFDSRLNTVHANIRAVDTTVSNVSTTLSTLSIFVGGIGGVTGLEGFRSVKSDGAVGDGSNNDLSGFRSNATQCFGTFANRHGTSGTSQNKGPYFPPGNYNVPGCVDYSYTHGFSLQGTGKRQSELALNSGNTNLLLMDGASYFHAHDFSLRADSLTSKALWKLDWSGAYGSATKPQQSTIGNIAFNGNSLASLGLTISESGGAAQGDTILLPGLYFQSFTSAALAIGVSNRAQNALGIQVINGDFQSCYPDAIANNGGQFLIDGTSFQNQDINQVEKNGADVNVYTGNTAPTVLRNVRSESMVISRGAHVLENCQVFCANVQDWSAAGNYTSGTLVTGASGTTRFRGLAFYCFTGGVAGANEPNWNEIGANPFFRRDATASAGTTIIQTGNVGSGHSGLYVYLVGAGTGGSSMTAKVIAVPDGTHVSLDTTVKSQITNQQIRISSLITDGTVQWFPFEYYVIEAPLDRMVNCAVQYGSFNQSGPTFWMDYVSGRSDFIRPGFFTNGSPGDFDTGTIILDGLTNGPWNSGSLVSHVPMGLTGAPSCLRPINVVGSIIYSICGDSADGALYKPNYFGRVDGSSTNVLRNVQAIGQVIGNRLNIGSNVSGNHTLITGGQGRGTGVPGDLILHTTRVEASSSTPQTPVASARVGALGELTTHFGYVSSVTAVSVASGVTYTPSLASAEIARITAAGNIGFGNPSNTSDGARVTLELLNNTAGAIAVNLGSAYLGTFTAPGAGKWRTQLYAYDATLSKLKPIGAISGDL